MILPSRSRDRATKPPQARWLERDVRVYLLRDGDSAKIITKLGEAASATALQELTHHLNDAVADIHYGITETTPEKHAMEIAARNFVSQTTGIYPDGAIYWQRASVPVDYQASHESDYASTYIVECSNEKSDFRYMYEMSRLVHELAHSTNDQYVASIVISTREDGSPTYSITPQTSSGIVIKTQKNNGEYTFTHEGDFFEEAFAEETAACWREQTIELTRTYIDTEFHDDNTSLPIRFFDYDYEAGGDTYETINTYAAYAAQALNLLSHASGKDLYNLQCQMRHPAQNAAAKRAFVAAIESVRPGLYRILRETEYTEQGFLDALETTRQVIHTP